MAVAWMRSRSYLKPHFRSGRIHDTSAPHCHRNHAIWNARTARIATALAILAVLAFQIAWFLWPWGAEVSWILPDLKWGFKYDLDLIQATAIAGVALLGPIVTYLIGRFHPKLR